MRTSDLFQGEYTAFYQPYIDVLGDVELLEMLRRQLRNFPQFIASIPADKWQHAYGEGKWTVAEVLLHVIDAERVFQYRALRFARGDKTALPGFDQDHYVPYSGANERTKESVIAEYQAVRGATLSLFQHLGEEDLSQIGIASGVNMSARALGFICCGHQKHHRNILRERYL